MADVYTQKVRSCNMSHIKGKGTKPEVIVRKYLTLWSAKNQEYRQLEDLGWCIIVIWEYLCYEIGND